MKMAAGTISLDQAKEEKLFYAVANAVVLRRSDNRCLILKRSEREKVHPKKYCVPGGKLEWKDLPLESPTRKNGEVLDYEQAIENLQKAISVNPKNLNLRNNLGIVYLISGKKDKAKEIFTEVLKFDPNNQIANQGLLEAGK